MKIYFFISVWVISVFSYGQIAVPNTTAVTENFNGMGAGTTAALPANWKMSAAGVGTAATWTTATNITAVTQGACAPSPTSGGAYNWGISAACTDRSAGFMTSGTYASSNSLMSFYQNTNANCINTLTISYDARTFRVNTAAASINFYYSLDGTTWTNVAAGNLGTGSFPTAASSYSFTAPPTTNVAGISITGLSIPNGSNFYLKWDVNTTGTNSQGIGIDNVSVTAAFASISAKPTIASSAIMFSEIGCNGYIASWTNGNGANRLVVVSAAAVAGTPTDGTVYTANSIFGSGSTIAAGEYAVYSGTGNSILITGLNASTTYYVKVFEYNGTNCAQSYLTTSTPSGNQATISCVACPGINGVMIDACNATCGSEGDNEIVFLYSGSYTIPALSNQINLTYNTFTPPTTTYVSSITSNAATISTMNTLAGCGTLFVDAVANTFIPVDAHFIMVRNTFCPNNYNMADFCAITPQPIYVIFSTDPNWITGGNFSNNSCVSNPNLRYFETNFSEGSVSCITDYNYDACALNNNNGAYATFNITGGAATSYSGNNSTCDVPIVLPVNLIEFKAEKTDNNSSRIHFTTASEKNVKRYFVSKSFDGFNYTSVGQQKALNELSQASYFVYDQIETATNTFIYYRLEEEDFNGERKIVGNCFLDLKPAKELIVNSSESEIFIQSTVPLKSIELFSADGKNVTLMEGNQNDLSFQVNLAGISKGFYLLKITDANEKITIKKIIH